MLKEHLTTLARSLATYHGVEINRVSWWVFADNKIVARLLGGKSTISTDRYELAMRWFVENWPTDLPWPAGVPRDPPFVNLCRETVAAASPSSSCAPGEVPHG